MTADFLLMKNELTWLAKNVLVALELTAGTSATKAAIQKNVSGSGRPSSLNLLKNLVY